MLIPIDVIAAMLYCMLTAGSRVAQPTPFGEAALGTAGVLVALLVSWEACCRLLAVHMDERGLRGLSARPLATTAGVVFRVALLLAYKVVLDETGWPGALPSAVGAEGSLFVVQAAGLAPYVLALSVSWISYHKLENRVAPGRWSRRGYVTYRVRLTLFALFAWAALWALTDLLVMFLPEDLGSGGTSGVLVALGINALLLAGAAFVFFPLILVRVWSCSPLPDGPVRDRLLKLQEQAGVRFNRMYVWRLGGASFLNAAAVGFVPPFRYLLVSEGLLEALSEEEIAGVVAHELGHVKHHHLIYYLVFTIGFLSPSLWLVREGVPDPQLAAILLCVLVAAYLRFVFGFMSRRFERQADINGLRLLGSSRPLVSSLEKIALMAGDIRSAKCWHHASVAERVAFLEEAEERPAVARAHMSSVAALKAITVAGALSLLSLVALEEIAAAPPKRSVDLAIRNARAHWLRVEKLAPDNARAPAMLAALALSDGDGADADALRRAGEWLALAAERATTAEDRERLEELRDELDRRRKALDPAP